MVLPALVIAHNFNNQLRKFSLIAFMCFNLSNS